MARRKANGAGGQDKRAESYKHEETRKNIPEAGLVDYVRKDAKKGPTEYCWDPRESPQLIWAGKAGMKKVEVEEETSIEVPLVNLHIHERVSTEAILRSVQRKDAQRSLFADPEMEFTKEIQFYQHDVDWSNRMVLGDSLLVMNSLLEREGMRGQVQCIYMDPPYGIKYASNFQPRIDQRDVKDGKDEDLTREVMQVQAFRDTWELGVHSYLTYLRDRLLLARELLKDEGSIFVQIGDENVHRVRCLMDEVFGEENLCAEIVFAKTSGFQSKLLTGVADYLLWYSKDSERVKFRQVYSQKEVGGEGVGEYRYALLPDGAVQSVDPEDPAEVAQLSDGTRLFRYDNLTTQGNPVHEIEVNGRKYANNYKSNPEGMARLVRAGRVAARKGAAGYIRFLDDFGAFPVNALWGDTGIAGRRGEKQYVVWTSPKVIERCILMTTDPGDLVLDPTCGSGTTAYVAEGWGRRWITMDTSRVALAIARHRLMTAAFDYYKLRHPTSGVSGGFVYKTVPHITLKSIAQNKEIDAIAGEFQPKIDAALAELNRDAGNEWKEWEVPRDEKQAAEFWKLKREMQSKIDASIAKNAPTEELVDQPEKEKGIVRVSGPFTMEAMPNVSAEISMEVSSTIESDAEFGSSLGIELFEGTQRVHELEVANASAYISNMIAALQKTGVFVRGSKHKIVLEDVRTLDHPTIHAEGEIEITNGEAADNPDLNVLKGKRVRCAVVFGPENGAISEAHVHESVRSAKRHDALLFCGYEFTGAAQEIINGDPVPGLRLLMAYISPDMAMSDLLKETKSSQLFTLVGEPDVNVHLFGESPNPPRELKTGEVCVELLGVDVYNPITGETSHDKGDGVHAIFIDHDYDGKSFCICQALFPNKNDSWSKIAKNLKGTIDEEAFEAMRTLVSVPFKPGRAVQVKVIDMRGNAVVKTIRFSEE